MEEIWKDVYHNGVYVKKQISNLGRMRCDDGRMCKVSDNGAGYLTFPTLSYKVNDKWVSKREYVHRLVARYFIDNPNNLPQVNHKDCNKSNNRWDNLEWTSKSNNILHAHQAGRMQKRAEVGAVKVLTVEQVHDLYLSVKRDKHGISVTARRMGIPRTTASSVLNKRSRKDITDELDKQIEA